MQDKSGQGYYGECDDHIVKWSKSWDSGLEAKILVKAKGEPEVDGWSVIVEFDKPVSKCIDYNAEMTKLSDTKFEARNKGRGRNQIVSHTQLYIRVCDSSPPLDVEYYYCI